MVIIDDSIWVNFEREGMVRIDLKTGNWKHVDMHDSLRLSF